MPKATDKELVNVHLVEAHNCLLAAIHQLNVNNPQRAATFIKSAKPHLDLLQSHINRRDPRNPPR